MTAQAKNARKLAKARQITAMHKNGEKGPAKTEPKHGKRWTYRNNPDTIKRKAEFLKAIKSNIEPETVLEKINAEKERKGKLHTRRGPSLDAD